MAARDDAGPSTLAAPLEHEPPFAHAAQQRVEASLHALLTGAQQAALRDVRPIVRDSWLRSHEAQVHPGLERAPLVWSDDELASARERNEWLPLAVQEVYAKARVSLESGHIVTLFDDQARMLACEGDPHAREGLAHINFRPGAQWSEARVGTNGPGTALTLGRPVQVVGAEHFCESWHGWHCAAAPVRDPASAAVLAVIDISGFRDKAHPHTLSLVSVMAAAIEQRLHALESERRVLLLRRFAELSARWPRETLVAVDRSGALLASSGTTPALLTRLSGSPRLRELLGEAAGRARVGGVQELALPIDGELSVLCRPIFDGSALAGSCLVLQQPARSAAGSARSSARRAQPHATRYTLADVQGASSAIERARAVARAAARNDLPLLITGESGTGKEVFAQSVHADSARSSRPFVAVNCAALSRELLESELFGYVGGAFSGARREGSVGKFELADGGTLFLDEIAELGNDAQATLLRVLQEGEVVPVGGSRPRPIDVRVIAATNRDVPSCLRSGALRGDLYHRLNVLSLALPSLRERTGDVATLAEHFLAEAMVEQGKPGLRLSAALSAALTRHGWPGNVRELRNTLRRLVAMHDGPATLIDLPSWQPDGVPPVAQVSPLPVDESLSLLTATLASARNMSEAAALLGVTRSTLYRRMARHGLERTRVLRSKG